MPSEDVDKRRRDWLAEHDAPCPWCGYNLRGVALAKCPECGLPLELDHIMNPPRSEPAPNPDVQLPSLEPVGPVEFALWMIGAGVLVGLVLAVRRCR